MDDNEKAEAVKVLNDCKIQVIDPILSKTGPFTIRVAGIDCMNENLQRVNVLYANAKTVHESDGTILQRIANGISEYFYERGKQGEIKNT